MDGDMLKFAQAMGVIISSVAAFITIAVVTRVAWRVLARHTSTLPSADSERLERLERSIDAIAIEVERISEAQRYTMHVLSDRLPTRLEERAGAALPRATAQRHDTPH